jgi:hypothetical protein
VLGPELSQHDATGGEGAFRAGPVARSRPGHLSPTAAARTRSDGPAGLGGERTSAMPGHAGRPDGRPRPADARSGYEPNDARLQAVPGLRPTERPPAHEAS